MKKIGSYRSVKVKLGCVGEMHGVWKDGKDIKECSKKTGVCGGVLKGVWETEGCGRVARVRRRGWECD